MTIGSYNDYVSAAKQKTAIVKTAAKTSVAVWPTTVFDLAGDPGAGSLSIGNTANGLVPDDSVAGYPIIDAFGGSAIGYLSALEMNWDVPGYLTLYDTLFWAGSYAFNANVTLASIPDFSARLPGGSYNNGLELWIEINAAFTGNLNVTLGYTNQANVAGRSSVVAPGLAPIAGRMFRCPYQAGDSGIKQLNSVLSATATVGTFNVLILRRLKGARIKASNEGVNFSFLDTGNVIYANSALRLIATPDGTSTGSPAVYPEIANLG